MSKDGASCLQILGEVLKELRDSLRLQPFLQGLWTPLTGISLALGAVGLAFTPSITPSITRLLFGALAEELTYRALIQAQLERSLPNTYRFAKFSLGPLPFGISYACVCMSIIFAGLHALTQTGIMSAAIFFPALILGMLWTRFRSAWLCALVHFWYNLIFFYA